jgi:CubicO group peptidase (beta-lactamase class C family)
MAWRLPTDAQIGALISSRIDAEGAGVSIVVGVIDDDGRRVVAQGAQARNHDRTLDGRTLFEIGSITKVFTTLLLADMAARGEAALDEPVARLLPAGLALPERSGRQITLIDLATHTAGLPRSPLDTPGADWSNPYASHTVEQLYAFMASVRLRRDVGSAFAYSNLGLGLLGHALALRAGADYETVIRERITGPLGMDDTAIALSADQKRRFAVPHDHDLEPVPAWDLPSIPGAGALRSTADDLLIFLAAQLGHVETPLHAAMVAQTRPRRPTDAEYVQSMGWRIESGTDGEIAWHGGATGGSRCFLMFDRARRAGVVVLTNAATARNDDIPFHLLSGRPLTRVRPASRVAAEALAGLEGRFRFSDQWEMVVTTADGRLFAQLTGQPRMEVLAAGPTDFFWPTIKAEMSFSLAADGRASGLALRQNGRTTRATRIG